MKLLVILSLFNGLAILILLITGQFKTFRGKKVRIEKARTIGLAFFSAIVAMIITFYLFKLEVVLNYVLWVITILIALSLLVFFISKFIKAQ